MTPAARVAAAIGVLDTIAAGKAAEQALTGWARGARYAGSKDRAAVRDHVFDVLRRWRSTAAAGGAETARARMIGLLRQSDIDPATLFGAGVHGPPALGPDDPDGYAPRTPGEALDMPDWLWPMLEADLGAAARPCAEAQRHRAPVFLRVNTAKTTPDAAIAMLARDGVTALPAARGAAALRVVEGARRVAQGAAYRDGLVELQDASSQAILDALPVSPGARILDFCAGGGGKALALAARADRGAVSAWDADPARMRDLPARAARAGARITVLDAPAGRFDLVLCDVPCSGSGAWRRAPAGRWLLTQDRLAELCRIQAAILDRARDHVAPGGTLAYATCSVLEAENSAQVAAFLDRNPDWRAGDGAQFLPDADGDGLFLRMLTRR